MKPLLLALALPVAALAWAGCGTSGNGLAPPPTFQCGEASLVPLQRHARERCQQAG